MGNRSAQLGLFWHVLHEQCGDATMSKHILATEHLE